MVRQPPTATRTSPLFPDTTLFRSPGEVNWMTAGRVITHSERFERARREGGPIHGIQAWVALPEADEETDPAFAHHGVGDLPTFEENGAWGRLVAGEALGLRAGVKTHRSEEHTSELQSLMRISYAVFCLKKKTREE